MSHQQQNEKKNPKLKYIKTKRKEKSSLKTLKNFKKKS